MADSHCILGDGDYRMIDNRKFYVYVGEHPVHGFPIYVGKGSKRRFLVHNYDLLRRTHRNKGLQRIYDDHGPIIWTKVRENLSEQEAFETEIALIDYFGRGKSGTLCNYSDGGDGPSGHRHSAEARAKISARNKGLKRTPEQCEKIRLLKLGTKMTAETRAKISAASKGRKKSEEHRAKIRTSNLGKKRPFRHKSPEHNAKVSAALKAFHAQRKSGIQQASQ